MKKKKPLPHLFILLGIIALLLISPGEAVAAAQGSSYHLDGTSLTWWWVLPFIGMLGSIALGPVVCPHLWEHNFGKITAGWIAVFLLPATLVFGLNVAIYITLETFIHEYLPFVLLLFSLYTISGGIRITGTLVGTPRLNTTIILIGTLLASIMGTTGAAMLLIRPLLRANAHRRYKIHSVVFFIFLVANIGGALTPLGDPPLFLGFLKGVSFFWTTTHLLPMTSFLTVTLLAAYFLLDTILYRKEGSPIPDMKGPREAFGIQGKINFLLMAGVVGAVLMSGLWKSPVIFHIWSDITLDLPGAVRSAVLAALAGLSLALTPRKVRQGNDFTWEPVYEVGKLFIGIFITMAPAIAILRAGEAGALKELVSMVATEGGQPVNHMYFWLTGILSCFLDNAPTYLIFFNLAGGDPQVLMNELPLTLMAISAGAVFMGACTYIGNAPNFMVRAIAIDQKIKMPSFFGYMGWSVAILAPLLIVAAFLFI